MRTNRSLGRSVVTFCLFLGAAAWGQVRSELVVKEKTSVPAVFAAILSGTFQCDSDANVYLRPFSPDFRGPVLKVSPRGKVTRFSLSSAPGFGDSENIDFALVDDGSLVILTSKVELGHFVVRFDRDGSYKSQAKLDAPISATSLAVFPSGELLVSGWVYPSQKFDEGMKRPALFIFQENGQLVREIERFKDVTPESLESSTADNDPPGTTSYDKAVGGSILRSDGSGNIYLMRYAPSGPLALINLAGQVLKVLRLDPPPKATLADIKIENGQLAATFLRNPNKRKGETALAVIIHVLDLPTGKKVAEYFHQDAEIGVGLACFEHDSFTFIGADDKGKLRIVKTGPKKMP